MRWIFALVAAAIFVFEANPAAAQTVRSSDGRVSFSSPPGWTLQRNSTPSWVTAVIEPFETSLTQCAATHQPSSLSQYSQAQIDRMAVALNESGWRRIIVGGELMGSVGTLSDVIVTSEVIGGRQTSMFRARYTNPSGLDFYLWKTLSSDPSITLRMECIAPYDEYNLHRAFIIEALNSVRVR